MELIRVDSVVSKDDVVRIEGDGPGEVILGRGALLKITDLAMSRNVARVNHEEGKFTLTAIGAQVFRKAPGSNEFVPIAKGERVELGDGDLISLAMDKFSYKIAILATSSSSPEPQTVLEEKVVESKGEKEKPKKGPSEVRTLPDWMLDQAASIDTEPVKHTKKVIAARPRPRPAPKKTANGGTCESPPPAGAAQSPRKTETSPKKNQRNAHQVSDSEEDETAGMEQNKSHQLSSDCEVSPKKKNGNKSHALSESDEEDSGELEQPPQDKDTSKAHDLSDDGGETSSQPAPKRKSCAYGASCYRKNPVHKEEEAHPGDDDYRSENEDEEDNDRPECEYGTTCFRKNPQHRKDFKHTITPRPKRKAKKNTEKNKKRKKGEEGEDDGDYDSSFIDDEDTDLEDISGDDASEDEWAPDDDSD